MKFKAIIFLLIVTMASLCFAEEKTGKKTPKPKHYPFNASLFYPVSVNKNPYDSANFNLSLFYGRVGRVEGLDLAVCVSVIQDDLEGVQITGLAGVVGDSVSGAQVSGLFNVAGDYVKGLQATGLINVTGEKLKGVQLAGIGNITGEDAKGIQGSAIFNITGEDFKGIQATGIFNITGEDFTGIQAADIINITGGNFKGIQGSAILNVVGDKMKGLQAGLLNVAGEVNGLQLGLVNVAGKVKGVQMGIVNYAKTKIDGVPVGLVNLAKHGKIRWVSWGSNLTAVNTGVKFMVNKVYSIVTVGGFNLYKDISEAISYGWHYGIQIPADKMFVAVDAGYITIDNEDFFDSITGNRDHHVLKLRGMVGVDISNRFSIFAGGGMGYLWDHGSDIDFNKGEMKPLFFAGIELF